ncbi:MAG: hypothetical protein AB7H77_08805 [Bdellovibrionales bacterium]
MIGVSQILGTGDEEGLAHCRAVLPQLSTYPADIHFLRYLMAEAIAGRRSEILGEISRHITNDQLKELRQFFKNVTDDKSGNGLLHKLLTSHDPAAQKCLTVFNEMYQRAQPPIPAAPTTVERSTPKWGALNGLIQRLRL